jgi:hypothetical protein
MKTSYNGDKLPYTSNTTEAHDKSTALATVGTN